jgi:hypothetical protein
MSLTCFPYEKTQKNPCFWGTFLGGDRQAPFGTVGSFLNADSRNLWIGRVCELPVEWRVKTNGLSRSREQLIDLIPEQNAQGE